MCYFSNFSNIITVTLRTNRGQQDFLLSTIKLKILTIPDEERGGGHVREINQGVCLSIDEMFEDIQFVSW